MARTKRRRTSPDPTTAYAAAVCDGTIQTGPHVRSACKRHLDDLKNGPARGLFFDLESAARAIAYFRDVLCLNGGEYEGQPYELLDWQCFIVGSLFGWKAPDGYRRFRVAYVETAKGSGKSPLAAGVGLYGLTADDEPRAECYAAATKKDQAMILFRDAVAMVDLSPALRTRILKSGRDEKVWNLAYVATGSFFRPISADDGQSGPRPHIALLDEIHEHKNAHVVEMLRAGTKSRRQAMIFMITNSGTDKNSVCWHYHEYAGRVCAGEVQDDSFFAYVCALDLGDDPFKDEACWDKVNPSLRFGLPGLKYLREQVREARGMPSKESTVRRLNFCQWVEAANPWISRHIWEPAGAKFALEDLRGRPCYGGLDLSSTRDLTALALVFPPVKATDKWRLLCWFWLPQDTLLQREEQDRVPYTLWRNQGWLEVTPGHAINKMHVVQRLMSIAEQVDVREVGYDRYRIDDFNAMADQAGVELPPMVEFGQGYKDMTPALDEFERNLVNGELQHNDNPVLTMCAANAVVVADDAGNRKLTKRLATGRIDGMVAAVMAMRRASLHAEEGPSVYEQRGVIVV
jgi:phage terminase large subunit-like protein